jgi:hypothetical protein
MINSDVELAQDIIRRAGPIGRFITPDSEAQMLSDKQLARKVYHLAATSNLPVFKIGSIICARKSVLLKWIEDQEKRNSGASVDGEAHDPNARETTTAA